MKRLLALLLGVSLMSSAGAQPAGPGTPTSPGPLVQPAPGQPSAPGQVAPAPRLTNPNAVPIPGAPTNTTAPVTPGTVTPSTTTTFPGTTVPGNTTTPGTTVPATTTAPATTTTPATSTTAPGAVRPGVNPAPGTPNAGGSNLPAVPAQKTPPDNSIPGMADASGLSLEDAVNLAIQNNVRVELARERINEAEANTNQALARLQPSLGLNVSQYDRTTNLKAQGLNFPGFAIPPLIGPYGSFDARINFVYHLFDPTLVWQYRIGGYGELVRKAEEEQAERVAGTLAALDYVECLRAEESVLVAEQDLLLAQRLQQLALHQQNAGVAAGLDVTRASVRVSELTAEVSNTRQKARAAKRELQRLLGIPLDQEVRLTDHLLELEANWLTLEQALTQAPKDRIEARVAGLQVELSEAQVHAAESGNDPKLTLYADAGDSGATPWQDGEFTRSFGVALSWPIFDGGLTEAETEAAQSRTKQALIQQADTLRQIDKEVRDAFDLMTSARERLAATREALELSRKELLQTEHRFQAGITTNLEVTQAQTSLTLAESTYLNALASYNVALVQVAASSGRPDLLLDIYHKALETK